MPLLPFALEFYSDFCIHQPTKTVKFTNLFHTLKTLVCIQSPLIGPPPVLGPAADSFLYITSLPTNVLLFTGSDWLVAQLLQTCKGGDTPDFLSSLLSLCPLTG